MSAGGDFPFARTIDLGERKIPSSAHDL